MGDETKQKLQSNLEWGSGLGVTEKCDVLIDKEYIGRRFRWIL